MSDTPQHAQVVDDEPEYDYLPPPPQEAPLPQVPSYIAVIRILAVLAMGLCLSVGAFLAMLGIRGVLVGIPIMLLAFPCYFGMGLAERLATRAERRLSREE